MILWGNLSFTGRFAATHSMSLRNLPSVEQLLNTSAAEKWVAYYGRRLTVAAIRSVMDQIRDQYKLDETTIIPAKQEILSRVDIQLKSWTRPTLQPVFNATGVILHTNLGRAPLAKSAIAAAESASEGYSNLEFDLVKGKRGSRHGHAESLLKLVTGAEDALVVNNNAAAVLLVLTALAKGKRVIIPRSQLVEIGGGFRVPDVMKQSGAKLAEIGTTNKLRLSDFEEALKEPAGLVMRAHRSNFKMIGFFEEPHFKEIVDIAHQHQTLFVDDLGSGALLDTAKYGMEHEPMVQESISAGADLVCFSGDKLIGGPQAGIIVGRAELISRLKKHPLARALRADKLCLAALAATLLYYLKDEAEVNIPVWRMMAIPLREIKARAESWKRQLGTGRVIRSESTVGGGSLPGESIHTYALALTVKSPDRFNARLRACSPAVIARTENDLVLFDPRTVLPEQDKPLLKILKSLLVEYS
jgi:L-seryl-tRNA(Ser) seleniumtransferase